MKYAVKFAPRAAEQIRAAATWWLENRPKAREAFVDELDRALELGATWPDSGQPYPHPGRIGARRLFLPQSRHHLYYVADHDERVVVVLALWHSARGAQPDL